MQPGEVPQDNGGDFTIGAGVGNHNNPFNGLIERIEFLQAQTGPLEITSIYLPVILKQ
jgi:hypothetical protein